MTISRTYPKRVVHLPAVTKAVVIAVVVASWSSWSWADAQGSSQRTWENVSSDWLKAGPQLPLVAADEWELFARAPRGSVNPVHHDNMVEALIGPWHELMNSDGPITAEALGATLDRMHETVIDGPSGSYTVNAPNERYQSKDTRPGGSIRRPIGADSLISTYATRVLKDFGLFDGTIYDLGEINMEIPTLPPANWPRNSASFHWLPVDPEPYVKLAADTLEALRYVLVDAGRPSGRLSSTVPPWSSNAFDLVGWFGYLLKNSHRYPRVNNSIYEGSMNYLLRGLGHPGSAHGWTDWLSYSCPWTHERPWFRDVWRAHLMKRLPRPAHYGIGETMPKWLSGQRCW